MNLTKRRETILTVIAQQHDGLSKLQDGKTDYEYLPTISGIYANSLINTIFDNKNKLSAELSKMRDAGLLENGNSEYENGIATLTWRITASGRGMLLTSSNEGPLHEITVEPQKQEPEQKTGTSSDNYEIRVMSLIIGLKKQPTYGEAATIASIEDEGGGEFVSLSQDDQKVNFNPKEWNYIDQAVRLLIEDCRE